MNTNAEDGMEYKKNRIARGRSVSLLNSSAFAMYNASRKAKKYKDIFSQLISGKGQ